MKLVSTKTIAKVAAVATGLATFASVSTFALNAHAAALTSSQVSAIISLLQSFGADSATIANVQASLTGGTPTGTTGGSTSTSASCTFTRDLTVGASGADVTCLQQALIAGGYSIPAGATGYFGSQSVAAVSAWQKAVGISPAAGYFGSISRAHWNLGGSSTGTGSTGGSVPVGSGNGLKVSLAATSPSGSVLVQGQGIGDIAEYTFANPTSSSITVTGLTFNRIGVSNDQTINNVYLYNGVNRLTDSAGVSNSQFSFTNAGGLFTVAAGSTYTVAVRVDIASGTSGQQLGAQLVSVASNGTLDSSDSFPINSGFQTISAANLAAVQFNSSTLPSDASIAPQSSYTVWQNSVSVSTNPVWLKSMMFTNLGSIDANSIGNFRLYVDGTQVGNAVPSMASGRTITFDLSASPVSLSTQTHIIKVLADVTGGASLTFKMSLQRSSDALFIDSQLNQPVTPTSNNSTTSFTSVNAGQVTIQSVSGGSGVSVSRDPASQSTSVSVGASNVNFATFDMLASGESTKVMDLFVCVNTSVSNGGLKNGKIFLNGVQVGSTKDIGECGTSNTDFALGSSLILPAGQTAMVSVYADAKTSTSTNLTNGENATITLVGQTSSGSNAQGLSSLNSAAVPVNDTSGNAVSVASGSLTATKFSGYADQTVIPGANNALLGEFTLNAGSTEGVNVNTIGITVPSGAATTTQNLMLKDMSTGTQLGTTISSPSVGNNSFSISNIAIPASGSKTIGIYGNVLSSAPASISVFSVTGTSGATSGTGATTGNNTSVTGGDVSLQQITFGSGSLSLALGANNPASKNVVAGASNLQVGDFTFSASNSSYTIQKLEVHASTTAAAAISTMSLQYTDVNGTTQTATASGPSGTDANGTYWDFTGLTMYVPSNDSRDVTVWISTPTISGGGSSISGAQIVVDLAHNSGFQAQDQSGSLMTSIAGGSDVMSNGTTGYGSAVVRKSVPTFAGQSFSTTAVPTTSSALFQFTVSADPAGAVDLDKLSFNVATSGSGFAVSGFQLFDAANPSIALNTTATSSIVSGIVSVMPDQVIQIPAGGSKTFILRANSIVGWASGTSVSVSFATSDSNLLSPNSAAVNGTLGTAKYIWTDRSLNSDSTGSAEWTNGYLLRDLATGTYSYTHS